MGTAVSKERYQGLGRERVEGQSVGRNGGELGEHLSVCVES